MKTEIKQSLNNPTAQLIVIGAGAAGLAAAAAAYDKGVRDIIIIERDTKLGGILNKCIHAGFGLHVFGEELTGPEYAEKYADIVNERDIKVLLGTMVLSVNRIENGNIRITAASEKHGFVDIQATSVVLAMGCRERPRGMLNTPGTRPSGIFTAGEAQYYVNIMGKKVGKKVVILGSGDIGLIMARRLTLEGAQVLAVCEIMPKSGGLPRNITQCLEDFDIPLLLSHTVTEIHGTKRVEAVTISEVDEKLSPIKETARRIECDTLLLSVGLIPENELSRMAGIELDARTNGLILDEKLMTSVEGIFACGNVVKVHDLVDNVTKQGIAAGGFCADYIIGKRG